MVERIEDVKPHKKNILIYPVPMNLERVTAGGIVMPDSAMYYHDKPRWGTVLAVGSEVTQVKPADMVIVKEGCGYLMKFQDEGEAEIKEYMFCTEEHLIAAIGDESDDN